MTYLAAIMLVCSRGDSDLASAVAAEAVAQRVPVEFVLAVAAVESGLTSGGNPLGVRRCNRDCIRVGVTSLANRLKGCGGDFACASKRYHGIGHANAGQYAARVLRIARFLRGRR